MISKYSDHKSSNNVKQNNNDNITCTELNETDESLGLIKCEREIIKQEFAMLKLREISDKIQIYGFQSDSLVYFVVIIKYNH